MVLAVVSYAGQLTVTAIAGADAVPDLEVLVAALDDELDTLASAAEFHGTLNSRDAGDG